MNHNNNKTGPIVFVFMIIFLVIIQGRSMFIRFNRSLPPKKNNNNKSMVSAGVLMFYPPTKTKTKRKRKPKAKLKPKLKPK